MTSSITMQRDTGLDFAKAIAISLVLFLHIQPLLLSVTSESTTFIKLLGLGLIQINLQVALIAVPIFFLVSLYLLYQKIDSNGFENSSKRCFRIGKLYLFWTVCQFTAFYSIIIIRPFLVGSGDFETPLPTVGNLFIGGPRLPIVGGSVFYFLFDLLVLVVIASVYYSISNVKKLQSIIGILIVIVSVLYFEILNLNGIGLSLWRIDNFIIYIPLSLFLLKMERRKLVKYIPFILIGYVLFSAQDIYLRSNGYKCGSYSRVSIVLGAVALLSSVLTVKSLKKNPVITFLSKYSLGIFATHKYWQLIVIAIFQYCGLSDPLYAFAGFPLDFRALAMAIIVISLTFISVSFGSLTPLKKYMC